MNLQRENLPRVRRSACAGSVRNMERSLRFTTVQKAKILAVGVSAYRVLASETVVRLSAVDVVASRPRTPDGIRHRRCKADRSHGLEFNRKRPGKNYDLVYALLVPQFDLFRSLFEQRR